MSVIELNKTREKRIDMEIVVDAYTKEERAMGWYYYLVDRLHCPFQAKWASQGCLEGEEVEILQMSPEEDCAREMFVEVRYRKGEQENMFSARLSDIKPLDVDADTAEAIADWHYWVIRNYKF
ncbi:MAG: calcium-binding protein [Geitlerinemataceae cyanobacterium]